MTIDATDPIDTSGDSLDPTQVCWTTEGENYDRGDGGFGPQGQYKSDEYSDGDAHTLTTGPDVGTQSFGEWDFTIDHTIPGDNFAFQGRIGSAYDPASGDGLGPVAFSIILQHANGQEYLIAECTQNVSIGLGWRSLDDAIFDGQTGYSGPDLTPGEHTIRAECTDSFGTANGEATYIDVVAPYDDRFESVLNFDTSVHTTGGYLDGPELYPDVVPVQLTATETRRDVTEATAEIDTNTTDANQYIELRIGSDAFDRTNNAASASTTGGPARSIDVTLGLTRYPDDSNPQSATPRYGYNGQSVDSYSLTANPDAISGSNIGEAEVDAIVAQGEITGDRLEESGELTAGGDLLTRSIFAPFDVFSSMSVRSAERISFNNDE